MPDALYIPLSSADGFHNMAVDEFLPGLCVDMGARAALRFYEWNPPAVSLGCSQSFDVLDLPACAGQGIDAVRRVTGGGAILHWQELTYCLVLVRDPNAAAPWRREAAAAVSRSLVLGLSGLGVRASAWGRNRGGARTLKQSSSPPGEEAAGTVKRPADLCFASVVENEIEAGGRKLAGCAHKFTRETFFSHGSVMTGPRHLEIAGLLRPDPERSTQETACALARNSVSLTDLVQALPAAGEMAAAFKRAFEDTFGLRFVPETPSPAVLRLVEEKAAGKRAILARAHAAQTLAAEAHAGRTWTPAGGGI